MKPAPIPCIEWDPAFSPEITALFLVLFIVHVINPPSLPLSDESFPQTCKIGLESCYYHQLISANFAAAK